MLNESVITVNETSLKILSKLGEGSYGTVYLVEVLTPNKPKHIKAAKIIIGNYQEGISAVRELDITSKLIHPNIVHSHQILTDIHKNKTRAILLMPVADYDMYTALSKKYLNVQETLNILRDVIRGLDFMHKNRYLHLDIKPMNILVYKKKGRLTDFGLSLLTENGKKYYPQQLITRSYRPPEVLNGNFNYTGKSDIWSLGITFLEVLSGATIFTDYSVEGLKNSINMYLSPGVIESTLNTFFANIPIDKRKEIINIVKWMLNINPDLRPSTTQLLNSSLFKSSADLGHVKKIYRHKPKVCDVIYYHSYDYLIRLASKLPVRVETVFLAADLYQRSLHYVRDLTGDFKKDWTHLLVLVSTCLYIAVKMIDIFDPDPQYYVKAANYIFQIDDIFKMETGIVQIFGGILYPENLFTSSTTLENLLKGFDVLGNCHIYSSVDIDKWTKINKNQTPTYNKYIPFKDFYPLTKYYKFTKSEDVTYIKTLFDNRV